MPERPSASAGADYLERLAICAELYVPQEVSGEDDVSPELHLKLGPRRSESAELAQALREPEILAMRKLLLGAMQKNLSEIKRLWPKSLGQAASVMPELERLAGSLRALWLLQEIIRPGAFLVQGEDLDLLKGASRQLGDDPLCLLLLAEAELSRNLAQDALEHASRALASFQSGEVAAKKAAVQGALAEGAYPLLADRTRYILALANARLGQTALAEHDLNTLLGRSPERTAPEASAPERARRYLARAELRKLRQDLAGMCADLASACALGTCAPLALARQGGQCAAPTLGGAE